MVLACDKLRTIFIFLMMYLKYYSSTLATIGFDIWNDTDLKYHEKIINY